MSNIEYDNFPKFLVSLGVVIVALPFIVTLFFLQENSVLVVSQESISGLTEIAKKTIFTKQQISFYIAGNIIYLFVFCIILGTILFCIGCKNWQSQQKVIDDKQLAECKQAIYEWDKLNQSEKQVEVEREMNEKGQTRPELSVAEIRLKQDEIRKEKEIIHKQIARRYEEVEYKVIEAIKRNIGDKYRVHKNISSIGGGNYDALAESILDQQDYIFEIKYLRTAYSWNSNVWKTLPHQMYGCVEAYEHKTNRKAKSVVIFIVAENQEEQVEKLKRDVRRYWADEKEIIVNVYPEIKIDTLTIADIIGGGIL